MPRLTFDAAAGAGQESGLFSFARLLVRMVCVQGVILGITSIGSQERCVVGLVVAKDQTGGGRTLYRRDADKLKVTHSTCAAAINYHSDKKPIIDTSSRSYFYLPPVFFFPCPLNVLFSAAFASLFVFFLHAKKRSPFV